MPLDTRRRAALLAVAVMLPLPVLSGCSSGGGDDRPRSAAVQDIAPAARERLRDGGTLRWALDKVPVTLNAFHADADTGTERVTGAVLPTLFTLDERGAPRRNPDYLRHAAIVDREPRQTVVYRLHPDAVWSDGRPLGVRDFTAQWKALRGTEPAFWSAHNAGYDRIAEVTAGERKGEVKVVFAKPYADWESLFSPLYPHAVTATPDAFNDASRTALPASAGPFMLRGATDEAVTLERNPRWWGERARLDRLVFRAVPRDERGEALAAGAVDLAEVEPEVADRIRDAADSGDRAAGPPDPAGRAPAAAGPPLEGATRPRPENGNGGNGEGGGDGPGGEGGAGAGTGDRPATAAGRAGADALGDGGTGDPSAAGPQAPRRAGTAAPGRLTVRKALEPAYTQLALNGAEGPLADERVRRAVARAIDRRELAAAVLEPLGLPAEPLGSHLLMTGQQGYRDHSGTLGDTGPRAAQALLADAGWRPGSSPAGAAAEEGEEAAAGPDPRDGSAPGAGDRPGPGDQAGPGDRAGSGERPGPGADGPDAADPGAERQYGPQSATGAGAAGPVALPAPAPGPPAGPDGGRGDGRTGAEREPGAGPGARAGVPLRTKNGRPLTLRFVLPSGPGSAPLRTVADRITRMLAEAGIGTEIVRVEDSAYFTDHIASGDFDLALYSWPATAFPATDARPVYAKPQPAADGSLVVEQNYARVGTDQIDQLFDKAVAELDERAARDLVRRADARIWAVAGSIPLYQRPQLVAVRKDVANAGAFGFATPRYQDIGFRR
ncbi:ABC transporter family substrate-binding protein [Streptomyces pactum]|uniref:ABC transporter family substrate-binding protein n=1 Tax=Streptomyces pactum TaxID=68249 RepID=A0ABS0NP01_9ACTN|nr:ABC transporter family substrate-binding protein [Streptomyces pactum]MBH5336799.1 ABC transporter family substrate-binding protein [Streptomyces pactum]